MEELEKIGEDGMLVEPGSDVDRQQTYAVYRELVGIGYTMDRIVNSMQLSQEELNALIAEFEPSSDDEVWD